MSESLLREESSSYNMFEEKSSFKDESSHQEYFEIDIIEETLKHIYSKSNIRKKLAYILAIIYKNPILIIILSFILGCIFFSLPLFLLYFNIFKNFFTSFFIMLIISFVLFLLNFLIRIIDDRRNNISLTAKWERKNLINQIGLLSTICTLIIGGFFLRNFFGSILDYNENGKLKLIYGQLDDEIKDDNDKNINEFLLNYIINCILLNKSEIKNDENKVINYISDYSILKSLLKKLCICSIFFFVITFNKFIQTIIIQVKYTISKLIIFSSSFCFCILIMTLKFYYKEKGENNLLSLFELILIIIFVIGYLILSCSRIWRICKNPKDKNFSIYKYDFSQLIFIYFFEFINIIGTLLIFTSIIISYIHFVNKNETFHNLKEIFLFLYIGFLLLIISYSYFYGHTFLALIFRPIALQFSPVKLKKNYIRENRNLSSYIFI